MPETTETGSWNITAYRDDKGRVWQLRSHGRWYSPDPVSRDDLINGYADCRFDSLDELMGAREGLVPLNVDNAEALLADRERLAAEAADLRALVATCVCPSWPPEGPSEECPVHGVVRAFNDATTEIAAMRPVVAAAQRVGAVWGRRPDRPRHGYVLALIEAVAAYEATGTARMAATAPTVGEETPATDPGQQKTAEGLVADLLRVSANLEEHIQTRADERAARQAAQEIADANGAIRAVVERMEFDKQRSDALIAELRRQLDVQVKQVEHYWPQVKRVQALADVWCKAGKAGDAQDIYEALNPKEAEATTNA